LNTESLSTETDGHPAPYCGRFAPSPSGPLHLGSLITATASYLQARANNGIWRLRLEDIDPPRAEAGADQRILDSLQTHGFRWDGEVLYQRHNTDQFHEVVADLLARDLAYRCTCSREQIRKLARKGPIGLIYPGTCHNNRTDLAVDAPHAVRLRTTGAHTTFHDALRGRIQCDVGATIGDFIIRRRDGLISYSLAVTLDDHSHGITEIVRGADLLHFTPAHLLLQQILQLHTPTYMHVPVALNTAGDKLSKQTKAAPINDATPGHNLLRCLNFLCQAPPTSLKSASIADIWGWASANWNPDLLTNKRDSIAQ
jgi:glutamyl-Q tRNA(Asp) synthetase